MEHKVLNFIKEQKLKNDLEILKLQKENKELEEIINSIVLGLEKKESIVQNITKNINVENCQKLDIH